MSGLELALRRVVSHVVVPSSEPRPTLSLDIIESGSGRLLGEPALASNDGQIAFEPGDVLFNKLRPYLAKSYLVEQPMQGSGELLVMRASPRLDPRFLFYVTLSTRWLNHATQSSYGLKMPRTSWDELASFKLHVPSLVEQRRIADFLDNQVTRIDAVVAARKSQVDALVEFRKSRAYAAVTGSSFTEQRSSSLTWAASLPLAWGEPRICQVARMGTGHTPSRSVPEYWMGCDIPWLTTGDVHRFRHDEVDELDDAVLEISEIGIANSAAVVHPAGTVALSRTASAGFSIVMGVPMATSQDYATWTPGPLLSSDFLLWCLRVMRADIMGRLAIGSTHKTIYFPDLMSIRIPLPTLVEQDAAVGRIQDAARWVSNGCETLRASIERLTEYKRSFITAAVTGEFDVSAASGRGVQP